jgi:cell wall-associated NlpC family hydrolase
VDTILADNGYLPVEHAQAGDLIICRTESGVPSHTGIVRFVGDDGMVLVESKWGPLGVFLHTPETQPYEQQFGFWRSPRSGHRLRILPEMSAETGAGIAVTSSQSPW